MLHSNGCTAVHPTSAPGHIQVQDRLVPLPAKRPLLPPTCTIGTLPLQLPCKSHCPTASIRASCLVCPDLLEVPEVRSTIINSICPHRALYRHWVITTTTIRLAAITISTAAITITVAKAATVVLVGRRRVHRWIRVVRQVRLCVDLLRTTMMLLRDQRHQVTQTMPRFMYDDDSS